MRLVPLAVVDTNILVSSILATRGKERQIVDRVRQRSLKPAISLSILREYESVLKRAKFRFNPKDIESVLSLFLECGLYVEPQLRLSISPHEPDNRLLECAETAHADFLITGNLRHFPSTHGNTRILNARAFLELVASA